MDGIVNNHIMLWCMGTLLLGFFLCFLIKKIQIHKEIKRLENKRTSLLEISMAQRFKLFHRWVQQERVSKPFQEAWDEFYCCYQQNKQKELVCVPDIRDFFMEEDFVQLRTHHKFFELLPGIFLSLGILGTFLSLVYATQDISTSGSTTQLNSDIQQLLSGMNGAFWSSIVGICCSLITQICNRVFYRKWLIKQYTIMMNVLDEVFPTHETPTYLLQTILEKQKEQTEDMKVFLANYLVPQIANVMKYTVESFTSYLEKSDEMKESAAQQQMLEVQAVVSLLGNYLNGTTNDQLEELVTVLQHSINQQEKVYQAILELVKKQTIMHMNLEKWMAHMDENNQLLHNRLTKVDHMSVVGKER